MSTAKNEYLTSAYVLLIVGLLLFLYPNTVKLSVMRFHTKFSFTPVLILFYGSIKKQHNVLQKLLRVIYNAPLNELHRYLEHISCYGA